MINLFGRKKKYHFTVMSLVSYPLSEREAELTLFDTNLFPFRMEIMLKNTSYHKNQNYQNKVNFCLVSICNCKMD